MSWMHDQASERRANRAAVAEQARLDADAAAERRIRERDAESARRARAYADRAERERAEREQRAAERARRAAAVRAWLVAHRVDLLIYPLAVASAIMAIPAMAAYGTTVYGTATGIVLPVLSELGMWAFALAVQVSRRHEPQRPLWALRTGVVAFAAVGFGLNLAHGLETGIDAGLVMGIASIAGVAAHQLVAAGPRATRTERVAASRERGEARRERQAARKIGRVERAAVRQAVAELDAHGHAELEHPPGRYVLSRGHRGRLVSAIDTAAIDTTPAAESAALVTLGTGVADEAAAWLAARESFGVDGGSVSGSGSVATADPDQTPDSHLDEHEADWGRELRESRPRRPAAKRTGRGQARAPRARSMDELRVEFARVLAADPDSLDPGSAESIRRRLGCSAARARQLRDDHATGNRTNGDQHGGEH